MKAYVFLDASYRQPGGLRGPGPMPQPVDEFVACPDWAISVYGSPCLSVSPMLLTALSRWRGAKGPSYLATVEFSVLSQAIARTPNGIWTVSKVKVLAIKDLAGYEDEMARALSAENNGEEPAEVQEELRRIFGVS